MLLPCGWTHLLGIDQPWPLVPDIEFRFEVVAFFVVPHQLLLHFRSQIKYHLLRFKAFPTEAGDRVCVAQVVRDLEHMLVLAFPAVLEVLIRLLDRNILAEIVAFSASAVVQHPLVEILVHVLTSRSNLLHLQLQRHVILEVVDVQHVRRWP